VPSWKIKGVGNIAFIITRGEDVSINANIGNTGGQGGNYVANLEVNGQIPGTQNIFTNPRQNQEISFSIMGNEPGRHLVELGDLNAEFETIVGVNWWLIGVLTAAFILLVWVAWYYGYHRRRLRGK
jgi:hypothetical protein